MKRYLAAIALSFATASAASAQDFSSAEVIVTGMRAEMGDYWSEMPAVGLRRTADFLVQQVTIRGDTRDETERRREIYAMLDDAMRLARQHGVELAFGEFILSPLTAETAEELAIERDNRPDSERVNFLVKAPLGGQETGREATQRIARYIEAVPEVGRAQMDEWGDATLSVVGPDRYRDQIAEIIADDARKMAARMGENYAMEVEGLNMPVQWARSGPSEVLLFIPYRLAIVPRP